MKKLVEEVEGEGLVKLMGQRVTLWCCRYIYTGKLIGVNDDCVLLTDCGVVFETGPYDDKQWKDYQKLPNDHYVMKSAIESFGVLK
jgi:hypothetical protein